MASYLDQPPQFAPYVSQLPVEAMVKVGVTKQQQYEQNVTKIQEQINNIAGLDVYNDVDKQYLQSLLDELGGNLRTFAAGDFSNFQLVNSVSGMTGQIIKDKNVRNAVSSTANIRKQQQYMEEDRRKGTLHPNNEIYFNDKLSEYAKSTTPGQIFSGNYETYTDYQKKWREIKKEFDIKEDTSDLPFLMDKAGNYIDKKGNILPPGSKPIPNDYMIRETFKGVDPEKLKQAVMSSLDDKDYRQMQIDAYVKYRGYTPDMLYKDAEERFNKTQEPQLKTIDRLNILRSQNLGNQAMLDKIDDQLKQYKTKVEKDRSEFDESMKDMISNPESFKNKIFMMDSINQFANSFSNISHIQQIVDSPIVKKMNEDRNYNMTVMKFQVDNDHWQKEYNIKEATEKRLKDKDEFDRALEAYKAGAGPNPFLPAAGKVTGGAPTDQAVLDGLIESFKQGADLEQNNKDKNVLKSEWAKNQLTKADYEKQSGRKPGSMTDAEYRKILEDQFNSNLAAYNQNPNNSNLTVTERKVFDKYARLDKIYKLKANLLIDTKNEVNSMYADQEANLAKRMKDEPKFGDWSAKDVYTVDKNVSKYINVGTTYTSGMGTSSSTPTTFDDENARKNLSPTEYEVYQRYKTSYYGKKDDWIKQFQQKAVGLKGKYDSEFSGMLRRKDQDYLRTLSDKVNSIAPQYSNLPTGSASKFLPVLNKFKIEQKGQTEEAEGYVKGKDFNLDTSLALANDKETTPTYITGLDRTYVTLVGKVKGKETTQSFVIPNEDFNAVFPGALGKNDTEFIQTAAANGSTNYKYPRLLSALSDANDAFESANYTNYNTKKYIVKADVFFDQTDKNSTIPVIYVKSKKTGKILPIAVNRDLTFNGSETTINQVTDASIIEQLKKQDINADF